MTLFIPGPTDVAPEVLQAQAQAIVGHRSQDFYDLFDRLQPRLQQVFQTKGTVLISASSGTGLQEAAMRNLVGQRVLVLTCGAFGERWLNVAQSSGVPADPLAAEWGSPNSPEALEGALGAASYDALAMVHNETSTGILNPVAQLAERARQIQPDLTLMVDAVSSAGGVELRADEWGLDLVLTSSQKCFALPPGLSFACVSERALEKARGTPNRGWYFDLVKLEKHLRERHSTPATPAVSLLYALDVQLDRMLQEGLQARFSRHAQLAHTAQRWGEDQFGLYAAEGFRSPTVTTILKDSSLNFAALRADLGRQGMVIADGYGRIKKETFRIGHMGEIQVPDLDRLLAAIDTHLNER